MPSITVRNVPEAARDELASRAAMSGRSLQEYLLNALIEFAERPDSNVLIARIRERKRLTGSVVSSDAIIAFRDADRS